MFRKKEAKLIDRDVKLNCQIKNHNRDVICHFFLVDILSSISICAEWLHNSDTCFVCDVVAIPPQL